MFVPKKLLEALIAYLKSTLDINIEPKRWNNRRLPPLLTSSYHFYTVDVSGVQFLLAVDLNKLEQTPSMIQKHLTLLNSHWDDDIIYIASQVSAHNRQRLVKYKVPFIIPFNQLYLPMLAIDFREHFKRIHQVSDSLSPSAQVLLIDRLFDESDRTITPKEAAKALLYTPMTMTRAFNELESNDLVRITKSGKERHLQLHASPKEIWKRAEPLLINPIKKKICIQYLDAVKTFPIAGIRALARFSMLTEPVRPTYALSSKDWRLFKEQNTIIEIAEQEPDALNIEVWRYSPQLFAKDSIVDPLSLYLSLKDSHDERVEAALEELLEHMRW